MIPAMEETPNADVYVRNTINREEMQQKLDDIYKIEQELRLDLSRPLEEQDRIIKLNNLAKRADDLHAYFESTKRYKSLVQYGEHPAGTILNEPALGMILFNAQHKQDFISIEDYGELNNDMPYHVQDIFFGLNQGPKMDDLTGTFSSLVVTDIHKKDKIEAKADKTEHEMEKCEKSKSTKSKSKTEPKPNKC
nr:hypothetical protein [Tanacetum cinerariifolium]